MTPIDIDQTDWRDGTVTVKLDGHEIEWLQLVCLVIHNLKLDDTFNLSHPDMWQQFGNLIEQLGGDFTANYPDAADIANHVNNRPTPPLTITINPAGGKQ